MDTIARARTLLSASKDPTAPALVAALQTMLDAATHARATMAASATARGAGNTGRAPSVVYEVEQEPGWRVRVTGSAAAHAKLTEALTELGAGRRAPSQATLAVTMSRSGSWAALVETDNGTVAVTVRKLAQDMQPSKTRAKRTKTP
jgi:hypothetical protein